MAIGVIIEFLIYITFLIFRMEHSPYSFEFPEVWWEEILVAWKLDVGGRE